MGHAFSPQPKDPLSGLRGVPRPQDRQLRGRLHPLTHHMPNGRIAPFKVEDFPYRDTLPQVMRQRGYSCIAMHGNTGNFFYRRPAYKQMGFSKVYFAEELRELGCPMRSGEVDDEELLRLSAKWLNEASEPTVHFIITLTSHGPFNKLPPEKRELFPQPASQAEAYVNSMRYVDRVLATYLESLPQGAVLVLYGDHESKVWGYQRPMKRRGSGCHGFSTARAETSPPGSERAICPGRSPVKSKCSTP